jgi:hypothetical protein
MKKLFIISIVFSILAIIFNTQSFSSDNVELNILKTLKLDDIPKDLLISQNKLFVLTENGKILIFSNSSRPDAEIDVDKNTEQIKEGPNNTLILSNKENKSINFINIDFIQDIDPSGSPYKGPKNAKVVIISFNDFQ